MIKKTTSEGITLKKKFGQHFLRDTRFIDEMLNVVSITPQVSLFEIGCGEGILTESLVRTVSPRIWVFEIDQEWADFVKKKYNDTRLTIFNEDFLQINLNTFEQFKPWILLANIPYQITFPLLKKLQEYRDMLQEAVIMIQEDVAQKIIASPGDATVQSLFYNYYFEWKLLSKVPPGAFYPPPKVWSRLVYFRPRKNIQPIVDSHQFWKFVSLCFRQRRRTMRNNLLSSHYDLNNIDDDVLKKRAQELSLNEFIHLWERLRVANLPASNGENTTSQESHGEVHLVDRTEKK